MKFKQLTILSGDLCPEEAEYIITTGALDFDRNFCK